ARAPRVPPPAARQTADPLAQLRKLDPRRPGGLGQEARPRHAGKRVGLETKDVALGAQPEVNARVTPELERPVRRQRQLPQPTSPFWRASRSPASRGRWSRPRRPPGGAP